MNDTIENCYSNINDYDYITSRVGRLYSEEEICKEYNIESRAYGGLLCSKKSDETLVLFNTVYVGEKDKVYYYKGQN